MTSLKDHVMQERPQLIPEAHHHHNTSNVTTVTHNVDDTNLHNNIMQALHHNAAQFG